MSKINKENEPIKFILKPGWITLGHIEVLYDETGTTIKGWRFIKEGPTRGPSEEKENTQQ